MSKFLVDAQLPLRLARMMQATGLDAVHTLDLPDKNRTKDSAINRISLDEKRIVVTKDDDFVQSFLLQGRPYKLLLINTGNITNSDLLALLSGKLNQYCRRLRDGGLYRAFARVHHSSRFGRYMRF